MKTIQAWHFLADNGHLRDGRPAPPDGEPLVHSGDLVMCESGLHASRRILDALQYARGSVVCRVRCSGERLDNDDKLVCRERTILWRVSIEPVLYAFARRCALDVVHLWDPPDVVLRYLKTGDEEIREAAWEAAREAAREAAWEAAREAARGAAWEAAWEAAREAARGTARGAAWEAAREAAWEAARGAAREAAWEAARGAAWEAARESARDRQSRRLVAMVVAARR